MKEKLVFYPKKMTGVCILLGISAMCSILTLLYPIFSNDYELTLNDNLRTVISIVLALAPVTTSFILLKKYKSEQLNSDTLLKLFFYVEAVLCISGIVFGFAFYFIYDSHSYIYDVLGQETLRYSSLMDYIKQNLKPYLSSAFSCVIYILLVVNVKDTKRFKIFRLLLTGMCLYHVVENVISTISIVKIWPMFNELTSMLITSVISCANSLIEQAALILLVFGAYEIGTSEIEMPIEEKFKSLNEKYAAGQIGKEDYEAERTELLKQL